MPMTLRLVALFARPVPVRSVVACSVLAPLIAAQMLLYGTAARAQTSAPATPPTAAATGAIPAAALPKHLHPGFNMVDTNHDGVLSLDEWTAAGRRADRFAKIDANHDGKVTREEIAAFRATMEAQRNAQAGGQPAGE